MSAVASFNDPRCDGQMVCPNDPLLFTCTVSDSPSSLAEVTLPSGEGVQVSSANTTQVVGATSLPDGVTVQSHNAVVDGGLAHYTLTLTIERASLLGGNPVICDARTLPVLTNEASCLISTGTALQCHTRPTTEQYVTHHCRPTRSTTVSESSCIISQH